jgi:UDP-N-acetylglucosamine/UDP-N-acetylgalactosamine 4-epimerase
MNKVLCQLKEKGIPKGKTWVVTGVAGFIGSHLVETLLALEQNVRGVDNFSTGKKENIDYLKSLPNSSLFSFTESDVNDFQRIESVFDGAEYVLHQAALGSVPRSIEKPHDTHLSNVTGFLSILDLSRKFSIKRVVYASSSSVYGDLEELPKVEERTGRVLSPYAASKMCNEVYGDAYTSSYGIEMVGLRYFNVFGPRQDPAGPYAAVIPRWIHSLVKGEKCHIYGDGETSRDFCYIENVVSANILSAIHPKLNKPHVVFNVACGDRTSLNELFHAIADEIKDVNPDIKPEVEYLQFRAGDIRHSHADISKISNEIGYLPIILSTEGLKFTVLSFLEMNR